MMAMLDVAGWVAPAATMIAAIMTAANLGARVTGWGFVVFTVGAIAWVIVGAATGQHNLLFSNAFLLLVDIVGVWRWLGRRARYDTGAGAATQQSAAAAAVPTLFAMSSLEGRPVRGRDGETIATAVEAMMACDGGSIDYLVVREGGVAGVGERLHAIGRREIRIEAAAIVTTLDRAGLARRPALDAACWPASAEAAGVV